MVLLVPLSLLTAPHYYKKTKISSSTTSLQLRSSLLHHRVCRKKVEERKNTIEKEARIKIGLISELKIHSYN